MQAQMNLGSSGSRTFNSVYWHNACNNYQSDQWGNNVPSYFILTDRVMCLAFNTFHWQLKVRMCTNIALLLPSKCSSVNFILMTIEDVAMMNAKGLIKVTTFWKCSNINYYCSYTGVGLL